MCLALHRLLTLLGALGSSLSRAAPLHDATPGSKAILQVAPDPLSSHKSLHQSSLLVRKSVGDLGHDGDLDDSDMDDSVYASADTGGSTWKAVVEKERKKLEAEKDAIKLHSEAMVVEREKAKRDARVLASAELVASKHHAEAQDRMPRELEAMKKDAVANVIEAMKKAKAEIDVLHLQARLPGSQWPQTVHSNTAAEHHVASPELAHSAKPMLRREVVPDSTLQDIKQGMSAPQGASAATFGSSDGSWPIGRSSASRSTSSGTAASKQNAPAMVDKDGGRHREHGTHATDSTTNDPSGSFDDNSLANSDANPDGSENAPSNDDNDELWDRAQGVSGDASGGIDSGDSGSSDTVGDSHVGLVTSEQESDGTSTVSNSIGSGESNDGQWTGTEQKQIEQSLGSSDATPASPDNSAGASPNADKSVPEQSTSEQFLDAGSGSANEQGDGRMGGVAANFGSGISASSGASHEQGDNSEQFDSHVVSSTDQQDMSEDDVDGAGAVSNGSGDDKTDSTADTDTDTDTGSTDISNLMTSRNLAEIPGNSWPSTLGRLHIPSAKEREHAHTVEQWHETNSNQLPFASEDEDSSGPSLRDSERDS